MTNIIENTSKEMSELSKNKVDWLTICKIGDIAKNTGVCADFNGKQVAIFHMKTANNSDVANGESKVKAICNIDPFSNASVLSRGLITEKDSQYFVASPLLKQEFCLDTGQCQQDDSVAINTYKARINGDLVQLMEA